MDRENIELWSDITFKTIGFIKNYDLTAPYEQFVTEIDGEISKIRFKEKKPPVLIGEFGISIWNFDLAEILGINLLELMEEYTYDMDSYSEIYKLIQDNKIKINSINKLVIIHHLVIKKEYRKKQLTEEFSEFICRNYYNSDNNKILALVKPFQYNEIDFDFYFNGRMIKIKNEAGYNTGYEMINANDYFNLNEFLNKEDIEINEYKLFNVANKCDFSRINNSHIFEFKPKKIINRIKQKNNTYYE